MRAARMYGYNEPLRLEEIPVPEVGPTDVLVKVEAAGMCRSDFQLIEGGRSDPHQAGVVHDDVESTELGDDLLHG
jgi:D-arabinose 1-dehydrogenase-like Zn-dependent alcohol dehydrogenase